MGARCDMAARCDGRRRVTETVRQLRVRLPEHVIASVERLAADERRSVNAQVTVMLERALKNESPTGQEA